jgi:hypothetical protein
MNDESRLKTYQITLRISTFEDGNNVQADSDALIKKWLNDFIQSQAQQDDQCLSESKSNFTSIFGGCVDNVEMIRSIDAINDTRSDEEIELSIKERLKNIEDTSN